MWVEQFYPISLSINYEILIEIIRKEKLNHVHIYIQEQGDA
jgi:hypothetical protein